MRLWTNSQDDERIQESLLKEIRQLRIEIEGKRSELNLLDTVRQLKEQIEDLKIQKSRLKEDHDKEDRELRHMIGLEKKRQEVETEQAKKGAVLEVKEQNLVGERKQFDDQMKFVKEQFSDQMKRIEGIYGEIIKRLPTVTVNKEITERNR